MPTIPGTQLKTQGKTVLGRGWRSEGGREAVRGDETERMEAENERNKEKAEEERRNERESQTLFHVRELEARQGGKWGHGEAGERTRPNSGEPRRAERAAEEKRRVGVAKMAPPRVAVDGGRR